MVGKFKEVFLMPGMDGSGFSRGGRGSGNKGSGQGRRKGGQGMGICGQGLEGKCVCPQCGTTVAHQRQVPCTSVKCPQCGTSMIRQK